MLQLWYRTGSNSATVAWSPGGTELVSAIGLFIINTPPSSLPRFLRCVSRRGLQQAVQGEKPPLRSSTSRCCTISMLLVSRWRRRCSMNIPVFENHPSRDPGLRKYLAFGAVGKLHDGTNHPLDPRSVSPWAALWGSSAKNLRAFLDDASVVRSIVTECTPSGAMSGPHRLAEFQLLPGAVLAILTWGATRDRHPGLMQRGRNRQPRAMEPQSGGHWFRGVPAKRKSSTPRLTAWAHRLIGSWAGPTCRLRIAAERGLKWGQPGGTRPAAAPQNVGPEYRCAGSRLHGRSAHACCSARYRCNASGPWNVA